MWLKCLTLWNWKKIVPLKTSLLFACCDFFFFFFCIRGVAEQSLGSQAPSVTSQEYCHRVTSFYCGFMINLRASTSYRNKFQTLSILWNGRASNQSVWKHFICVKVRDTICITDQHSLWGITRPSERHERCPSGFKGTFGNSAIITEKNKSWMININIYYSLQVTFVPQDWQVRPCFPWPRIPAAKSHVKSCISHVHTRARRSRTRTHLIRCPNSRQQACSADRQWQHACRTLQRHAPRAICSGTERECGVDYAVQRERGRENERMREREREGETL